uniref:Pol polyprotein n=1 Tax=Cajanus cajan TaxID=3821 RepID=A0A151RTI3_CAJCA|nr:Pol polyprotein [Cajanus cajan]
MDILRPFPPAKGQLKFLLVAIDYFTKWIEACPRARITAENVQKFTWKSIICRFGILHSLVTDNGRQFIVQSFEDFLRELGVKHLPTSETPYRLTFGTDAMIPVEVRKTSHRQRVFDNEQNAREAAINLDLNDELREKARIHEEACKLRASRRYNTQVRPRSFRVDDLVWRLLGEARRDSSEGKLAPNWDGPFRVMEDLENGAY